MIIMRPICLPACLPAWRWHVVAAKIYIRYNFIDSIIITAVVTGVHILDSRQEHTPAHSSRSPLHVKVIIHDGCVLCGCVCVSALFFVSAMFSYGFAT